MPCLTAWLERRILLLVGLARCPTRASIGMMFALRMGPRGAFGEVHLPAVRVMHRYYLRRHNRCWHATARHPLLCDVLPVLLDVRLWSAAAQCMLCVCTSSSVYELVGLTDGFVPMSLMLAVP